METGSEEVDLKAEVNFEAVSNVHVCTRDQGIYCVCGINGGGGGRRRGYFTTLEKNLTEVRFFL